MKSKVMAMIVIATGITGCNDDKNDPALDSLLDDVIVANSLTGDPLAGSVLTTDINDPRAVLGKRLFFSKALGGDEDAACVTCHHPMLGGGDGLSLPVGVGAEYTDLVGPGRHHDIAAANHDGGPTVPRNAPTTFNLAGWSSVLFHDGRLQTVSGGISTPDSGFGVADTVAGDDLVQAQARFPVTSPEEMKGFARDAYTNQGIRELLAGRLGGYGDEATQLSNTSYWINQFAAIFDPDNTGMTAEQMVTEQNISSLIGFYERSQVFIDTPWKAYIEGDLDAISDSAKRGALLFYGKAGCSNCHTGDFFTDEGFHNVASPQIGRGKGHGDGSEDFGRSAITSDNADLYKFRTPSLLNVEVTGPYTHAGAYTTLEAMVRHHLNPQDAINNYDFDQLGQLGIQNLDSMASHTQKAIDALMAERSAVTADDIVLRDVSLSDEGIDQLVDFLVTLTDICVKNRQCMTPWITDSVDDADPNALMQIAVDQSGGER